MSVFAIIGIIAEAIQVILFLTQGRLPALAYKNSISVRFGSVLDDPNGFAILVALVLPVVAIAWKSHVHWRRIFIPALLVSLLLTQSFTGVTAVVVALCVGYFALNWRRPIVAAAFFIILPVAAIAIWKYVSDSAVVESVWLTKGASIDNHTSSLDALSAMGIGDFLGFGEPATIVESSYVSMISTVGLPFTVMYVSLGLFAIVRLHRSISMARSKQDVALQHGMYFYLIAYLIGSINMQFVQVFPVDLLYVIGICLSLFMPAEPPEWSVPVVDSAEIEGLARAEADRRRPRT